MNILDHLTRLRAESPPLYETPSCYYCRETDTVNAILFHRDKAGHEVLKITGDYAREYAKALIALPQILAALKAAQDYHKATLAIETWVEDGFPDAAHLFAEQARSRDAMFAALAALGEVRL